jgi:molybdate transport system ATP-binding protein
MKIINARSNTLYIDRFIALGSQAWCIVGANRSGIEAFFRLVSGQDRGITADQLERPENFGVISFKEQQALYEAELRADDTDFLDRIDPGTPARSFLRDIDHHSALIEAFAMTPCLDKGYRQLSTGQSRKLLLLSQITNGMSGLAIQAPYEGLDPRSRKELDKALCHLHRQKVLLVLFVHNREDIPSWCTHAGVMVKGRLTLQGPREAVMSSLEKEWHKESADFQVSARRLPGGRIPEPAKPGQTELVCLNNGVAGYGEQKIFQGLTLTLHQGDHTLITGPNGSGKSTLLQMITGDHPACYQNDLRIFGIQRGSGESIWELKQHMGIVSSELHRNYYVPGNTISCIISGLFDSIGVYRPYTRQQEHQAMAWLERLGMPEKAGLPFRDLSYADQRLVLIARALIKLPRLLVLDEPTQGMDELNRMAVLDFLEDVAKEKISTLLYVSHRRDEFRDFFGQHLQMGDYCVSDHCGELY